MTEAVFQHVRVSGKKFERSSMVLDIMWFETCTFEDCDVFYSGGPVTVSKLCQNPTFSFYSGYFSAKSRFPDLLEKLVVRSNGRSCWSRVVWAQSRRAPFTKNSMNSKGSTLSECVIRREQKKRGCWHKTPA
jgi:hypothetical protein